MVLRITAYVLMALGAALAIYDVITVALGTANTNKHMPFVYAFALSGLGVCLFVAFRARRRIDAPDGTSD